MEKVPEISRFFERMETSKVGLSQRPKSIKEEKEDKMEQRETLAQSQEISNVSGLQREQYGVSDT